MVRSTLALRLSLSVVLLAAGAHLATAQEPASPERTEAVEAPAPGATAPAPRVQPTPLVAEMLQLVAAEREEVAALRGALTGLRDHRQALAILRRIEQIKLGTEIALLQVQITHAKREGRHEVAAELERALSVIQSPPGGGVSVARPATSAR